MHLAWLSRFHIYQVVASIAEMTTLGSSRGFCRIHLLQHHTLFSFLKISSVVDRNSTRTRYIPATMPENMCNPVEMVVLPCVPATQTKELAVISPNTSCLQNRVVIFDRTPVLLDLGTAGVYTTIPASLGTRSMFSS